MKFSVLSYIYKGLNLFFTAATNINDAVTRGVRKVTEFVTSHTETHDTPISPIVLFLTDGDPTIGETNLQRILSNVDNE